MCGVVCVCMCVCVCVWCGVCGWQGDVTKDTGYILAVV